MSAGPMHVMHFAVQMTRCGLHVRVLEEAGTNQQLFLDNMAPFYDKDRGLPHHRVQFIADGVTDLPCHPDDLFMATHNGTAAFASRAQTQLNGKRFLYFIQDDERLHEDGRDVAIASYTLSHFALFSTHILAEYFCLNHIGVFSEAAGAGAGDARDVSSAASNCVALKPAIPVRGPRSYAPKGEVEGRRQKRSMLVYARPYQQRNRFDLVHAALRQLAEQGELEGWQLHGVGCAHESIQLSPTVSMSMQYVSHAQYLDMALTADVGIALIDTPPPVLVPMDMAACGLVTVTNVVANKDAAALRALSCNLEPCSLDVAGVVSAVRLAMARADDVASRQSGMKITDWPTTWHDERAYGSGLALRLLQQLVPVTQAQARTLCVVVVPLFPQFGARIDAMLESYQTFAAGADHDLLIVYKHNDLDRCSSESDLWATCNSKMLAKISHRYVMHVNDGFDIGSYVDIGNDPVYNEPYHYMCFLSTDTLFQSSGWLAKMLIALVGDPSVGVVSTAGSYQAAVPGTSSEGRFPNPHVRTAQFAVRSSAFRQCAFAPVRSKAGGYEFEHGRASLTNRMHALGLKCMVVDRTGHLLGPRQWHYPNGYNDGDHSEMLATDINARNPVLSAFIVYRFGPAERAVPDHQHLATYLTSTNAPMDVMAPAGRLVKAEYGHPEHRWVDVTDLMQVRLSTISSYREQFWVRTENIGCDDPVPGIVKFLMFTFIDGSQRQWMEGHSVSGVQWHVCHPLSVSQCRTRDTE